MSNPGTPAPPITGTTEAVAQPQVVPAAPSIPSALSFTLTGNRGLDTVIALLLAGASARLAEYGAEHFAALHTLDSTTLTATIFGVLATLAAAAWAWINAHFSQSKITAAVQAGVNLAVAGKSLTVTNADGTISPKPVTAASAAEIIKNYADVKVKVPDSTP
jgi:ABC-type phosphate transport system substrate-binding protein